MSVNLFLWGKTWPLALGVLALPAALWAQSPAPVPPTDWKRANEAVAQFPRGHADVLKWEQAQSKPLPEPVLADGLAISSLALPTGAEAVRLAWQAHRDLAIVQARAGTQVVELIAQGEWAALDPRLAFRVRGLDELMAVAAQTRKAWLQAVAAQQVLKPLRERADSADAAFELGQRMVAVGNWSALQLAPVQLAKAAAHRELARARYAAAQAQHNLLKLMPSSANAEALALPAALPELPTQPLPTDVATSSVAQRLQALRGLVPPADSLRHATTARLALAAYQASWAVAQGYRDEELPTRQRITDDTLLHYNGMLKSVWDLLTEVGNQSQARVDAIHAQRDFFLAQTDLHWLLQGGLPDALVNLSGGTDAAPAAGH